MEFKKRMYAWTLQLIKFINSLPKNLGTEVMGKQLMRSGTSVIANYTEASSASSRKDFANFFSHALKSANESKVWLALIRDTNETKKKEVEVLLEELNEIAKILASSIITLKEKRLAKI